MPGPSAGTAKAAGKAKGRAGPKPRMRLRSQDGPYALLGLMPGSTTEEIKKAYYELSLQWHPDKDKSSPAAVATARFQRLKEAYELLRDPVRRAALDRAIVTAPPVPSAAQQAKQRPRPPRPRRPAKSKATTIEVLDSEEERQEEEERDAEWAAAERRRAVHQAKRKAYAEEQARRQQARDRAKAAAADRKAAQGVDSPGRGYVRLLLRKESGPHCTGPAASTFPAPVSANDLEAAFGSFHARVISLQPPRVVLAVPGDDKAAVACALFLHGWTGHPNLCERDKRVFKAVVLAIAPVAADGRAVSRDRATLAVSLKKVALCDEHGARVA